MATLQRSKKIRLFALITTCLLMIPLMSTIQTSVHAQNEQAGPQAESADTESDSNDEDHTPKSKGLNIFALLVQGGFFMIPILALSILVVTLTVERGLGLRRNRVLPEELIDEIAQLGTGKDRFDPRKAFRICQNWPSAAASVVKTMLNKVGRPISEVEHAVGEASEREAERLYANVRWLNLAAAVAPLMGLFGTVWGMIVAFHDTTQLDPGQNKAEYLAKGIYVALVTTLAGLAVAIPAAICAHWFEGKIQSLFHQIDEFVVNLIPQIERYEKRDERPGLRFVDQSGRSDEQTKVTQAD